MALAMFDRPLYVQRKYFLQEITGLGDLFDFMDEWPPGKRGLAYESTMKFCCDAAKEQASPASVRENFRRFLIQNGMLAELEDVSLRCASSGIRQPSGSTSG